MLTNFINELRRRNVFKVATAYVIAGWLIIQIVTVIEQPLALPDWFDTAIIILVAIGFPIALIIAWAFELTPEGMKKSDEVAIAESVTNQTGKKLNKLIITVLSVALVFLLSERIFFAESTFRTDDSFTVQSASIAVLPFVNMSSDEENEYFSDGLSEELLNALAKIEDLQVAGRTSSFKFKGQNEDLKLIGEQLGVNTILEGSVRKDGDRLRITAQLIRVEDGFHIWSETYDRELTVSDIFDIQEEISRHVSEELKVQLLPEEELAISTRPTQDIEAYNAYLAANQIAATRQADDLERAIELYKQALRLDPGYADAHAKLAYTYLLLHENGDIAVEEMKELMQENIDKALRINNTLPMAFVAESALYQYYFDNEKRLESAIKAYRLAPNDPVVLNTYYLALRADSLDKKYEMLGKAYRLDPLNSPIATNYARYLIDRKNEYEKANEILNRSIERNPDYAPAYAAKAWLLRDVPYGQLDEAFKFAYEAYLRNPDNLNHMKSVSNIARDVDLAGLPEHIARKGIELYPNNNAGYRNLLLTLVYEDRLEEAEDILDGFVELYGDQVKAFFRFDITYMAYSRADYEQAIEILKFGNGTEVFETGIIENNFHETLIRFYIPVLEKLGRNEEAEEWAIKVEDFMLKQMAEMDEGEDYNRILEEFDLSLVRKDYKKTAELFYDIHFDFNSKANWPIIFQKEIVYFGFKESEFYPEVRAKLDADLAEMRSNIVKYLKEKGEWREEWESGLN